MSPSDITLETEYYIHRTGMRIKEIRSSNGWSQQEMADKLGTTRQRISKIEQGKFSLKLDTIVKYSLLLNKDIIELLPSFRE